MGYQGSLMHVGSEGWPAWSNTTDKLLLLKLLKKLMLVLIERCIHSALQVVVYGDARLGMLTPCPP